MASIASAIGLQCRRQRTVAIALLLCAFGAACSGSHVQPGRDGAFVVLLPRDALEVDPRFTVDAYGLKLSRLLFASLVTIDSVSLAIVPDLAQQVEIPSPETYRVRLRPGLRFSDGSTLDAEDVAATFRGLTDPALGSRYAQTYKRIERIDVEDPLTVVFHLSGPHATFMTDLEIPVLRAEDARRHVGTPGGPALVGSGPYVLRERVAGRIELEVNPHWLHGRARHPRVRMLVIHDDNTRALRMLGGAGDLALNAIPALLLPLFQHDPRFEIRSAPGVGAYYLGLNLDEPALRDVRVRRALAYAIDREALIRAKLGGHARFADTFLAPGHWAHSDDVVHYAHDPARAKQLLAQAGFTPERNQLRLTLRCGSDRFRQSIARAIAAMLADVGVEVDVRPSEVATLIADLNRGRFEITMLELPEVIEPHVLSWWFGSDHVPGPGRDGANRWRFRNAAFDAAVERGRGQIDTETRKQAYSVAQRILSEELPAIPLWHEDTVAVESAAARDLRAPRLGRFDMLAR
jgi:peptide/nickel transport system substrate-binding protein